MIPSPQTAFTIAIQAGIDNMKQGMQISDTVSSLAYLDTAKSDVESTEQMPLSDKEENVATILLKSIETYEAGIVENDSEQKSQGKSLLHTLCMTYLLPGNTC